MNPRQTTGPMGIICIVSGALYAACMAVNPPGSMGGGFFLIGLGVSGFASGAVLGGAWLEQLLWDKGHTAAIYRIALGLLFALGAGAIVVSFIYIGMFSLVSLLITLFTAASFYGGIRLISRAGKSPSPLLRYLCGGALVLAGLAVNIFILYRLV